MQDIANAAGVGKATVSLALRDDPRLREETRHRIQKVAENLGYRANAVVAQLMAQLRASKTPKFQATLGLINASRHKDTLARIHTFKDWERGCRRRAEQIGYGFDDFWLYDPDMTPERLSTILESRNIRGLVVAAVFRHGTLPFEFAELWSRLACVVVGIQIIQPRLHFASNDQFSTAYQTVHHLANLGYSSPALIIDPRLDTILDYRFSSGFGAAVDHLPSLRKIPVLEYSDKARKEFNSWFLKNKPDAIITLNDEIRDWLGALKVDVPGEVGLAHLDLNPDVPDWAGMKQNNDLVGMAAVDMLVGQLHRNEFGPPDFAKCMLVESTWVDGATLRSAEVSS